MKIILSLGLLSLSLFFSLPADAAIALDATAHPGGAMITAVLDGDDTTGALTSPSFSSAAIDRLVVVSVGSTGNGQITYPGTLTGAGLVWVRALGHTFVGVDAGCCQAEIYEAYALTILNSVTVTWTPNVPPPPVTGYQSVLMNVYVLSGAAQNQIGAASGVFDNDSGSTPGVPTEVSVTASASGSWIAAVFMQVDNSNGVGTALTSTTPFDSTHNGTGGSFANGRLKSPATTASGTAYTLGAGDNNPYNIAIGLEILVGGPNPVATGTGGMMGFF